MGAECRAFIEVQSRAFEVDNLDYPWHPIVDMGYLLPRHYQVFCLLFGVRCSSVEGLNPSTVHPLAADRGAPPNQTMAMRERICSLERTSWATLTELEAVLKEVELPTDDWWEWRFLADTMRHLVTELGADRVRLVVGFVDA